MNHLNAITAQLDAYQLDALCITSQPGEYYAVGLKGEGVVLVTRQGCHYFTDSRYIELAQNTVTLYHSRELKSGTSKRRAEQCRAVRRAGWIIQKGGALPLPFGR